VIITVSFIFFLERVLAHRSISLRGEENYNLESDVNGRDDIPKVKRLVTGLARKHRLQHQP
jgi:hypothetical protein